MSFKVFHIVTHFDLGGAEKVAVNIASSKNPDYEYHLVEVVRGRGGFSKGFVNDLNEKEIRHHRSLIHNNKIGIILFPFWFLFLVLKYRPAIIHTHTEVPDLSVFLFYKLFGSFFPYSKYVRTIHNTVLWSKWEKIGNMVEMFFLSQCSNIAISESVRDSFLQKYEGNPPIIYNGMEEVKQISFEDIDRTKVNVLFAGRLEYQKGIDELIGVIKGCKGISGLEFWIIGDGSLHDKLMNETEGFFNVHYYEKIFGLSSYLSSFDYLFMPSNFEGLALMPIEASLAKIPTIINSCPGLEDTLPKDWPLKVNGNNVEEYIEIFTHIADFDKRTLGMKAYEYAMAHFSIEEMQRKYENRYEKLINVKEKK